MGGCGNIQASLVPESWMHIYKETHTAPLMSFCFTEEHSVWSWKRLASGILYKRWTGTQCSGRLRGSRDLPTGLGQAMLRGEQSSMDMTSHLVGVGGCWAPLLMMSRQRRQIPKQQWGDWKVSGTRREWSGKHVSHSQKSESVGLSIYLHPSLPYTVSGVSILISGVVQTQT